MTQHPIPVGTTVYVEADAKLSNTPEGEFGHVYFPGGVIGTVVSEMDSDGDYLIHSAEANLAQYVGKAYVSVPVVAEEG